MKRRHRKKGQTARLIASVEERARQRTTTEPQVKVEVKVEQDESTKRNESNEPNEANSLQELSEPLISPDNPLYEMYQTIAARFQQPKPTEPVEATAKRAEPETRAVARASKKQKVSLVELKEQAARPELIDWYDADAKDPELLVALKCAPGVVQVPAHWQNKNEYLKGRGFRHNYELPGYIKDTGISSLRDVFESDQDTLRQKTRERVQPKLGKMDVDYRKLYAAFFKFQSKPRLFAIGQVYQEGREVAMAMEEFRPGVLSQRLRAALGIGKTDQPPWTDKFKELGQPPAYPGLNSGETQPKQQHKVWGEMILDESDAESEESDEESVEESDEVQSETEAKPEEFQSQEVQSQEVQSQEVPEAAAETEVKYASDEDRQLYRELSESTTEGALGPSRKYNL